MSTSTHPAAFTDSTVAAELQVLLVATLDLTLAVKQAHWNLSGPGFLPVHQHLDVVAAGLAEHVDRLAERAVTLGTAPDGRAGTIASISPIPPMPAGALTVPEATELVADRLDVVAALGRSRIESLGEKDPVSQDAVIGLVSFVEQERWMLRSAMAGTPR